MLSTLLLVTLVAGAPLGETLVTRAREVIGTPYSLGGRLSTKAPGIDCQGVLFYAVEKTYPRCGWRSYSVMPSVTIPTGELGRPVGGAAPIATEDLDIKTLEPGDFLWLVGKAENAAEPAIGELGGTKVWVWHTGLYAGDGRFIVGDHYAGEAVEVDLMTYLREHRSAYQGLIATRIETVPKPARCRRHRPMNRPVGKRSR